MMPDAANMETAYEMGRRLFFEGMREFRLGRYFEAHDLWEEFWQELRGPDRIFVQALIHLAVGAYHYENKNMNGAHSQLRKAAVKLAKYPDGHWGITAIEWLNWIEGILDNRTPPIPGEGLAFEVSRFPCSLPMAPR